MASFALLVGINDYPLTSYSSLKGPPNDLNIVRDWLMNDAKVPKENVVVSASPDPAETSNSDYPPTANQIWAKLRDLVFEPGSDAVRYRPNDRIYLYFSGHGFSSYVDERPHAALFAGNAAKRMSYNVCGTTMAQWLQRAGVYGEIVLVMDCCRDREISKRAGEPHFDDIDDPARAKNVRRFEIYAVPYGEKAQERQIPSPEGPTYGLLTWAFVQALRNAPTTNGVRTANDIKRFIEGAWGTLVGDERVEAPYFVSFGRGEIEFPAPVPVKVEGTICFSVPLAVPAQIHIADDQNQPVLRVELGSGQQTLFDLVAGGASKTFAFDGSKVAVALPLGVYKLIVQRVNQPDVTTLWTLLGGADVEVAL